MVSKTRLKISGIKASIEEETPVRYKSNGGLRVFKLHAARFSISKYVVQLQFA